MTVARHQKSPCPRTTCPLLLRVRPFQLGVRASEKQLGVRGVLTSGESVCAAPVTDRPRNRMLGWPVATGPWHHIRPDTPHACIMGKSAMRPVCVGPKQRSIGAEKTSKNFFPLVASSPIRTGGIRPRTQQALPEKIPSRACWLCCYLNANLIGRDNRPCGRNHHTGRYRSGQSVATAFEA
jgi:hypothetical protein